MTLPEAIGQYLRTEATATLAHYGASKLFWCYETQNVTAPFLTFRQSSCRRIAVDIARAGAPRVYEVEIVHFAASQSAAWTGAEAAKSDLDNLTGLIPSTGTVRVKKCIVTDEADLVSEEAAARGLFAVSQTLSITV